MATSESSALVVTKIGHRLPELQRGMCQFVVIIALFQVNAQSSFFTLRSSDFARPNRLRVPSQRTYPVLRGTVQCVTELRNPRMRFLRK